MGLAGRKTKQRISNDPRNLAWSENAAKFGHTYLAKLGWNPALGLGIAGDGRTTNIAVAQKLDQLGIGAGRSGNDKDGIAWKQQDDFEQVLARLNRPTEDTASAHSGVDVVAGLGFVASTPSSSETPQDNSTPRHAANNGELLSNDRKRKRSQLEAGRDLDNAPTDKTVTLPPRRFAHHRARLLNSKRISAKSASEISEVLGVPSSTSATPSGESSPAPGGMPGALTPISDDKISTSAISMSAYFKEKMQKMKSRHKWMTDSEGLNESEPGTPENGPHYDDESELPRRGLGTRHTNSYSPAIPLPLIAETAAPNSPALSSPASDSVPIDAHTTQLVMTEATLPSTTRLKDPPILREKKKRGKATANHIEPTNHAAGQTLVNDCTEDERSQCKKGEKSKLKDTLDDRKAEKRRRKEEKKAKKRANEEV